MGLKFYLNLFKTNESIERVKFRYTIGVFAKLACIVLFIAYATSRNYEILASSIFGCLTIAIILFSRIHDRRFVALLEKQMNSEALNQDDEVDAAFISLRNGFTQDFLNRKKNGKKLLILDVFLYAAIVILLPVSMILQIAANSPLGKNLDLLLDLDSILWTIANSVLFVVVILIIIIGVVASKNDFWFQSYTKELHIIDEYKNAKFGQKRKYKILEDKKPNVQIIYLFPDQTLREKYLKLQKVFMRAIIIFAITVGVGTATIPAIIGSAVKIDWLADSLGGIIFIGGIAAYISFAIVVSFRQNNLLKTQYSMLCEIESKNLFPNLMDQTILYKQLHEIRTPFVKRWNKLFVLCFLGAVISNSIFGVVFSTLTNNDIFGLIFLLVFAIEFIAIFVYYFKSFAKIRLQMINIENEIDRLQMNQSANTTQQTVEQPHSTSPCSGFLQPEQDCFVNSKENSMPKHCPDNCDISEADQQAAPLCKEMEVEKNKDCVNNPEN